MSYSQFIRMARITALALFSMLSIAIAQPAASINGIIIDAKSKAPLTGAQIVLLQTGLGASAELDGSFLIHNIPPGSYTIEVSHLGYREHQERLTLSAGGELDLRIRLQPAPIDLSAVLVQGERSYSAASSRALRQFDLRIRPASSSHDILQLAPGLVIAQHAGGGKAEQIFLRGFDADHGTDVAVFSDGIPVNMVSHGHGQGYADLHFLIPEIVETVDVFKGPYFARFGNLATAGAINFETKDHLQQNLVRFEGGEFNTSKLTTIFQIPSSGEHQGAYFAGQFYGTDGPVRSPQNFQRFNVFGKFHTHLNEDSRIAFSLGAFSSAWDASGQVPLRAVESGLIDRFGSIDDLEGGTTSRQNLNFSYQTIPSSEAEFLIQAYASRYNFKLFSNFTFFLNDSLNGDMIEQTDQRTLAGLNTRYRLRKTLGTVVSSTTAGAGFRADDAQVALWKSPDRVRETLNVDADIFERNLFLWLEQEFILSPQWRLQLGLRSDYFTFNVEDHLDTASPADSELPHASGNRQESIISPKFNLAFSPLKHTEFYLNAGSGFHSNDARNVVISQRIREIEKALRRQGLSEEAIQQQLLARNYDPAQRGIKTLPRAIGGELGLRTRLSDRVVISLAAWGLDLEEELVFVGDEGTTEISGRSRRIGVDIEGRAQLANWLWADADVSISEGRSLDEPDGADDIPLAPRITSTGGMTVVHPTGFEGSLRYRHIGDRPANEFNSVVAEGYTLFNLNLGYRFGDIKLFTQVENLLDIDWSEAQFDTESRLRNESEPVSEIHFTPGNPRNVQVGLSYQF